MRNIDASDVLIVVGVLITLAGLYFLLWPLAFVGLGTAMTYVGVRRS